METSQNIKKYLQKLPSKPGVYFFVGKNKQILYIGKATVLKDRVKSYFSADIVKTRGPGIFKMLSLVKSIDFKVTDSALEALLLETDLIKKIQPKFNAKEKDDKSYNCVVITKEDFPQILLVRKKDIDFSDLTTNSLELKSVFGPFPHGIVIRDVLKIIRKIFPYRDSKCQPGQLKPCFNRQIGLCPGVCSGDMSKKEYKETIKNIGLFFSGNKKSVVSNLEKQMKQFASLKEFEKAGIVKRQIGALKNIQETSLLTRNFMKEGKIVGDEENEFKIEAYDIAHTGGENTVGAMVSVINGVANKSGYKLFKIRGNLGINDSGNLAEILERRFKHSEWKYPDLIVLDGNQVQINAGKKVLERLSIKIPIVAVTKNEKHKPVAITGEFDNALKNKNSILLANSEVHRFVLNFHRKKRSLF